MNDDLALTRRIQIIKNLTTLYRLSESTRREKTFNWNKHDDSDDEAM
jgi:hypothetical protein